jgi:hypothetical protein
MRYKSNRPPAFLMRNFSGFSTIAHSFENSNKWLRFVAFTICGARGNLLQSHNGPIVDYHTSINDVIDAYIRQVRVCSFYAANS